MTKLAAVLGVALAGSFLAAPASAQACRERCRIRGPGAIRVSVPPFAVRVGWPRAHILIRGPILGYGLVADGPPPPPPPEAPPPPEEPPPAPAYPPEPTPPPAPPVAYGGEPPTAVYVAARRREPSIAVGVRGSALRIGRDGPEATGVGALLRFRARPIEFELEIGRDAYRDGVDREDTRLGATLYLPLTGGTLSPFLLVGAGMNFASFGATGDELHQGFLSGGGGLAVRLGERLSIAADARYMLRRFFDSQDIVDAQGVFATNDDPSGIRDQAAEIRLNALLYF